MRQILRAVPILTVLALAVPAAAQDTLASDRQLRQRAGYGISRVDALVVDAQAMRAHLVALHDALHARIVADSLTDLEPAPDPDPDPDLTPVTDLAVVGCGRTWCDLAWTHDATAEHYGVWVMATEPDGLAAEPDFPYPPWPDSLAHADTLIWSVTADGRHVGYAGIVKITDGSCAWPITSSPSGRHTCRAEGILPGRRYSWVVRPVAGLQ